MSRIAVIGIGQSMRGDDAAGLEAVRAWQSAYPGTARDPETRVTTAELPGLALLDLLDGVEAAIIVDAVEGSAPGALHDLGLDDLEGFTTGSKSAHGWGVAEALKLGRAVNPKLERVQIRLIGIEAAQYEMGCGLSAAVKEAVPRASALIQERVEGLLGQRVH